jgi:hypothetical protein
MTRSEKDFASQVVWFLATIFRGDRASFGRSNAARASQRMMRGLYPTEGAMRSEDKEYRQRNHRPSYQHENPVEEHRDIVTQICAFEYEVLCEPHRPAHDDLHAADRGACGHLEFARAPSAGLK